MANPDVKFTIGGDNSGWTRALEASEKAAVASGAKITKALKTAGIVAGAGLAAAAAGGVVLNRAMSEAVGLANAQERAESTLGAVLRATGEAAGYNLDQLKGMASAMQGVSTVGDEVILSGMSILATFKNVRGEGFERATAAALDMSAVMGTDLNSAMVQVGKALNDPIKGLTALSRVGVSFTAEQKEQIKVLQESGDIMGAQTVILRELESEFGGASAALREIFGGAVTSAENSLGDLEEQIGFTITKNEDLVGVVSRSEEMFGHWTEAVKRGQDKTGDFDGGLNDLLDTLDDVGQQFFEKLPAAIEASIQVMTKAIDIGLGLYQTFVNIGNSVKGFSAVAAGVLDLGEFARMSADDLSAWFDDYESGVADLISSIDDHQKKITAVQQQIENANSSWLISTSRRQNLVTGWTQELATLQSELGGLYEELDRKQQQATENIVAGLSVTEDQALDTGEAIVDLANKPEGAGTSRPKPCKWAKEVVKCFDNVKKSTLDTGMAYGVMAADWMDAKDVLTRNIIDQSDLLSPDAVASITADLDAMFEAEKTFATEASGAVVELQQAMVNDMGQIMSGFITDVLTGQVDSIGDLFKGLFDSIWQSFARLLGQMAANSLIETIFGSGSSGGITIQGLLGGSGGGGGGGTVSAAAGVAGTGYEMVTGESVASSIGSAVADYLGLSGGGATVSYTAGTAGQTLGGGQIIIGGGAEITATGATTVSATSNTIGTSIGAATPAATGSGSSAAAAGTTGIGAAGLAIPAVIFGLTRLAHAFPVDRWNFQSSSGQAVRPIERTEDPLADLYTSLRTYVDGIVGVNESFDTTYIDYFSASLDVMANQFGDSAAQMALSLDGSTGSTDEFVDALAGYDVATQSSAELNRLAAAAADGSSIAMDQLRGQLTELGISGDTADLAAGALVSTFSDIPPAAIDATDAAREFIHQNRVLGTTAYDSAKAMEYAQDAANGTASGMANLRNYLESAGLTGQDLEKTVWALIDAFKSGADNASSMRGAVDAFSNTDLDLEATARLNVEVSGDTVSRTTADISGTATTSSGGIVAPWVRQNYDGGIFVGKTLFRPGNSIAERGPEAAMPLPYGPNMLADIYKATVGATRNITINIAGQKLAQVVLPLVDSAMTGKARRGVSTKRVSYAAG